ncbi:MAG: hypothetical protein ACFE0R_07405 [Salinarimonas sp.]
MTRPRNRLVVLPAPTAPRASGRPSHGSRALHLVSALVLAGLTVLVLRAATADANASADAMIAPPAAAAPAAPEADTPRACDPRPWLQAAPLCRQTLPDGGASRLVRIVSLAPTVDLGGEAR